MSEAKATDRRGISQDRRVHLNGEPLISVYHVEKSNTSYLTDRREELNIGFLRPWS